VNRFALHVRKSFRWTAPLVPLEVCRGGGAGGARRFHGHLSGPIARGAIALLAVAAAIALSVGTARAEVTHLPLFALGEIPAVGPHGEAIAQPGPLQKMESMTVDSGHLWVAELNGGGSRVDEFDATTGAFLGQPVHVESPIYGEDYGTGIAVGHAPGAPAVYVGGQSGGPIVSVFDEAGALVKNWTGASTPGGSFGGSVRGVAVDDSTNPLDAGKGDVYVAVDSDPGVIDVFHPEVDGEEHYVGQIVGVGLPYQMAVDQASGEVVVEDETFSAPAVDVFKPTGLGTYELAHEITGPAPSEPFGSVFALTVDSGTGDIYVSVFGGGPYRIDQFSSAGAYLGQIPNVEGLDPYAIAADSESHDLVVRNEVYGPNIVTPDMTIAAPANIEPESATLKGAVNPDGAGPAKCEFEWGTSSSLGNVVPCSAEVPNGTSPVAVQASLSGLERDTTYYYRLRASNANGTSQPSGEEQLSTFGIVLREEFAASVASTSVNIKAAIDPGGTPSSYYLQYGTSSAYGQDVPAPPGEAIGSGSADVPVNLNLLGLTPETIYHYRIVVVSEVRPGELETIDGADHTFLTQPARSSFALLDGRQWELVSQASKLGALIEGFGFGANVMQASATGDAIAYRASAATESEPHGGFARTETVLSTRGAAGWSSQDISPSHEQAVNVTENVGHEFQLFSEDLAHALMEPVDSTFTPLSPEASETTPYLRTDLPGEGATDGCTSSCYRPLVTGQTGFADVPPGTVFGEEPSGVCIHSTCGPLIQGASPDLSHIVLSSPVQLTATPAPAGADGLYEWSAGSLQLLDVLPPGEEGPAVLAGSGDQVGVRHAISDDGQRVVLEGGSKLYLREVATGTTAGTTIRLDVPQGASGPSEGASYMDASADGSRIFFLGSGQLVPGSSPGGADLYEYDLDAPAGHRLSDLTVDPHAGHSADVTMVLGASEDGEYVYFAAAGALTPGAVEGECPSNTTFFNYAAHCNIYVRHEGVTQLVAALPSEDQFDWETHLHDSDYGAGLYARVSPNGQWLAFMSAAELTGYDTHDAVSGQPDLEVYLYHAPVAPATESGSVICASCNPTGARPLGELIEVSTKPEDGSEFDGRWVAGSVPDWTGAPAPGEYGDNYVVHQPRYLSSSGRLFFDSTDALVPQDVDGTEDAYEYEPAGVGSCSSSSATFAQRSGGCVDLISAGISPVASTFLDASESGGDVFFMTQAQLAPQDYDTAYDVYDAHECSGAVPCLPAVTTPPACDTEASCKAAPSPQPALYGAPASATFSGTGNLTPAPTPVVKVKAKSKSKSKSKPKRRSASCGKRSVKKGCPRAKKRGHGKHAGTKAVRSPRGGAR
jgi:hypothetical protein